MAASEADTAHNDLATTSKAGSSTTPDFHFPQCLLQSTDSSSFSFNVPLAQPEDEFLDLGESSEMDVPNTSSHHTVDMTSLDSDNVFADDPGGGEGGSGLDGSGRESSSSSQRTKSCKNSNGHLKSKFTKDSAIMDSIPHANGSANGRKWLEKRIAELEELERKTIASVEAYSGAIGPGAQVQDLDFLEFAEKYFSVQVPNSGYTGAISKTVKIVRRKSLTVSIHNC